MTRFYFTLLFTACANALLAQATFWQQTPSHPTSVPGRGNICIATGANDAIFTGTISEGIFRTTDQGNSWQQVLASTDTSIIKIWSDTHGKLFAIGANTVFASTDNGNTWQRKVVPSQYPLTDLEVLGNGQLIVSASEIVDYAPGAYDHFGDGVLMSADGGNTWQKKNNGIGYQKAITQLAVSSGNVLVAAMAGTNSTSGGLYYSTDLGENWVRTAHPYYKSKKDNYQYTPSTIYEALCLEFKEGDTLYLSYEGIVSGNTGSSAGVKINLNGFLHGTIWEQVRITLNGYEWQYNPFFSIHHAKKQAHTYAGIDGGQSYGAGYLLRNNKETNFRRVNSGISMVNGAHPHMLYAEDSEGRIYATLYTDYRVYYTDSSKALSSGVNEKAGQTAQVSIYPNPANAQLHISCDVAGNKISQVAVYSTEGKLCLHMEQLMENNITLPLATLSEGVYFVHVQTAEGMQQKKIFVTR